jgi:DNA mismatch endonuclease (patch repair protein)
VGPTVRSYKAFQSPSPSRNVGLMVDKLDPTQRSENMRRVRSRDTRPEKFVRQLTHRLGYRFRLHRRDLPGSPDLVFPRRKKVIFIHGCFWHRHEGCARTTTPGTRTRFWTTKFAENQERDRKVSQNLRNLGWMVMVVWECELKNRSRLGSRIIRFLGPT